MSSCAALSAYGRVARVVVGAVHMTLSKALIVDDSRTSAAILGKMLSRQEIIWDQVDSGEDCLAYLVSASPDIIFMDHMMPGMDGFQAVKAILQQPELCHIPIVMHTSRHSAVYYGQARALGAVGVLQKPATQQDLSNILERVRASAKIAVPADSGAIAARTPAVPSSPQTYTMAAQGSEPTDGDVVTALPRQGGAASRVPTRPASLPVQFRRALIVDDSRTSAAVLARMLERHDLVSDRVDSGEECLLHLATASPDIIFMDHMMPGMDGFEAVRAIKERTQLRAIPIVMYTSQSGDMYLGKARALGAVGVLKKPPTNDDLMEILNRITAGHEVDSSGAVVSVPRPRLTIVGAEPSAGDNLEVAAAPVTAARRGERAASSLAAVAPPSAPWSRALIAGGTVLLAISLMFTTQLWRQSRTVIDQQQLVSSLTTLGNQAPQYGFGAIPFGSRHLQQLREVVSILTMAQVPAVIELRAHVGEFCRVYGDMSGAVLPVGPVPIEACDLIGYESAEAHRIAMSQSHEFRQYINQVNMAGNGLSINVVPVGTAEPIQPYPPASHVTLAAEWNGIAARNQRVETRISVASVVR